MHQPVNQPGAKFCSQCGSALRADVRFCGHCGQAVVKSAPPNAMPPTPPPYQPHKGENASEHYKPAAAPPALPSYQPPAYTPQQVGASDPTQIFPPGQQPHNPPPASFVPPGQSFLHSQQPQPVPFTNTANRVNLSLALQFPFATSNWFVIMLIGGILVLIPVIGTILVNGYIVEIIRRIANDDYDVLPGWDDLGTKARDGLAIFVLLIIWAFLPVLLLSAPGYLLAAAGEEDAGMVVALIGALLGTFVTYFFLPIVWGRYAVTNQFMAGLQIWEIWEQSRANLRRYFGNWLLSGLMLFLGITVITILASISGALMVILVGICVVPFVLMAGFYTALIQAHLMGQLYRIIM